MTRPAKLIFILAFLLGVSWSQAQTTINAVYFGQTHVQKATDAYFGLVGNREALIKAHVVNPTTPASPVVTATLTASGLPNLVLTLTGPATLPASIPDGLGVVQHSFANTFTGYIPVAYMKTGLQVTVNAGAGVSTTITNMKVSAPTKVILTMTDVQYFSDTSSDYAAGIFEEIEAKWPVADLEVRRLGHVVFPELVIPPRGGARAARIKSKAEYTLQTGLSFDGEQAAALAWNGALKRAAGRSGRWSYYYLNVYNANAGGQAGGFAGVGSGTNEGILQHESGHAMSLPHWGDSGSYPYKGAMHGISAPAIYNATHAGPIWAFDLRTKAFIPPTVQAGNVGGKTVGTYKADPMQGGGSGWQEPAYQLNHFSDYSVNQMRNYLNGHVVVWNPTLNSWAQWNATAGAYTTTVSNDGVQYPTTRDTPVITIMASISGSDPEVTMVYPPIGPYTAGQIRLFDPTVAADRTAAQSIFSPTNGSDVCARVVQGGVQKTYMLAASWVTNQDPYSGGSLVTEAINLPASGGAVTKIELLLTPNVEDVGLPANPQVLYTWAPLTPEPSAFQEMPKAYSSSAVTMKAVKGNLAFGFTGTVEYQFTETTGNPGATSSGWQTSRSYTDTGLQAGTTYSYTVSMRAGALTSTTSGAASATTFTAPATKTVTVGASQQFSLPANLEGFQGVTGLGSFDAGTADKLVVVISTEDGSNSGTGYVYDVRYNGKLMTEAIQEEAGSGNGTAAIFYLDSPGPKGAGTIEVSAEAPNGGIGAAYALTNTLAGVAVTNSRTGTTANSVSLTTAGQNSVVIAVLQNSGNPNNAGTPTATAPLIQGSSGSWGTFWGSHASGYQSVASPSAITPTFSTLTGTGYSINIAAAEFPAQPPLPNSWTQTAGGAQSWTTALNWDDGVIPNPTSSTTLDFSSVDLLADTALTLGANRIARIWKFGDTSGTQNWSVNAGNTITLAGTTPTIEVKANTTQLNNVVAGTAGLAKTGAGTLFLNGTNTYTGVTRISAGTLQAATLTNGGSAGSIGSASNVAGNLILNGGTLRYTGVAVSTDRLFSLQASSSLDASGTGALHFANTGAMGFSSSTADKTLTLTGSNTGSNTLAASIGDNLLTVAVGSEDITTGYTTLIKSGAGTWVLSGNNTYTGTTTVSGGILRLTSTSALGGSPLVSIGGNRLEIMTDSALSSSPAVSSQLGTFVSDRATPGAGLTRVFGNASIGNGLTNFAAGANVTSGTAVIQLASVTNNNGSTATPGLNPTTADLVITGNVSLGVTNTGTANFTLGGTGSMNLIGGAIENGTRTTGNVIKNGSSSWSLAGTNTYNGTTTISGGTLVYRNLGAKSAGTHSFSAGTTLGLGVATSGLFFTSTDVDNAFAGTMTGNLGNVTVTATTNVGIDTTAGNFTYATSVTGSPSRGLAKLGANTLTLTGSNTYTGPTTISGGTLALGASNILPTTAVSIGNATLNAATFSDTLGSLAVTGSAVINLGGGASLVFADTNSISWPGTLTLTGTFVSGSSLRFGTTAGGLTPAQLAKISATGFTGFGLTSTGFLTATAIGSTTYTITNTTTDPNGSCTPTGATSVTSGGNQTYILTPSAGYAVATLTVNGVPVTPALSYTFTNVLANQTISATFVSLPSSILYWDSDSSTPGFGDTAGTWGTSQFWTSDASGSSAPLPLITATSSSINFGSAMLNHDNAAVAVAASGVNAGNITFGAGQSTELTLSGGSITLGAAAVITVNNTANTIDSILAGAATSLTKAGAGSLTLGGANTYSGPTSIATGTLRLGAENVLPDGSGAGNIDVAGTLDLNTFSETLNGLSGAGTVDTVDGGTPTLTLGGGNATSTFTGTITDTTGTLNLVKTGSGTLILTGANGYSGLTTLSGGTLQIGAGGTTGSIDSTTGITSTAALIYNRSDNFTVAYNISGSGSLTKQGAGVLTLSGDNSYTGSTSIGGGTLRLANTTAVQDSSGVSFTESNTFLQLRTDSAFSTLPNLVGGYSSKTNPTVVSDRATAGAGLIHALGTGNFGNTQFNFTAGSNVTSGTAGISLTNITMGGGSGGTVTLNPTSAHLTIMGNATGGSSGATNIGNLTLGGTSQGNSIGGAIQNGARTTQNLSKTGTSTWTLSGDNSYTGNTTVTGGFLITTKAAALPGFNATPIAKVAFNGGTIGVRLGGSGWTTTEVDTLLSSATKTSGALGIDTTNGNLTQWTAFTTTNLGSTLGLTKLGANVLTLDQANTYAGATTISGGTLALGTNNALPTTAVSIGSATLDAATFTDTVGSLNVTGNAVIHLGPGAALAFATGSPAWTGTLTLTGTFVSGSSLRFGTTSGGLTPTQLGQISAPGFTGFALNGSGFLTATATGISYALWAATNATGTTPDQDQDNDGVSNAVEYILGGNSLTNDLSKLPTITPSGENMLFSFKRIQSSIHAATAVRIQVGTTLQSWPGSFTVGADTAASSAGVTVLKGVPAGFDTVTLSVPRAPDLQKFIRLQVTITP